MIDEKKIEVAAVNASIEDTAKGRVREDYVIGAMADHELGFQEGFKSGINWFKENLWHDAMEQPKHGLILVEFNGDMEPLFALHQYKEYTKLIQVYRWLYIEDLMKGGK